MLFSFEVFGDFPVVIDFWLHSIVVGEYSVTSILLLNLLSFRSIQGNVDLGMYAVFELEKHMYFAAVGCLVL